MDGNTTIQDEQELRGGFSVAYKTDVGAVRKQNQDSVWALSEGEHAVLVVADGMGGHKGGMDASTTATEMFRRELERRDLSTPPDMDCVFEQVSEDVSRAAPDGGTTLVAAIISSDRIDVWHVGDSRAYVLRDDSLVPVTIDHSWVQTLVNSGKLTAQQAAEHPRRNVLLRAIGNGRDSTPEHSAMRFLPGDVVMLCSDGLHGVVGEQEIAAIMGSSSTAEAIVDALIAAALAKGAPDNIGVAVAQWETV